jgi:hypothetical protein
MPYSVIARGIGEEKGKIILRIFPKIDPPAHGQAS